MKIFAYLRNLIIHGEVAYDGESHFYVKLQPHGGVGISIGGFIIFFFSPFQVEVVGRKVFGIFFITRAFGISRIIECQPCGVVAIGIIIIKRSTQRQISKREDQNTSIPCTSCQCQFHSNPIQQRRWSRYLFLLSLSSSFFFDCGGSSHFSSMLSSRTL